MSEFEFVLTLRYLRANPRTRMGNLSHVRSITNSGTFDLIAGDNTPRLIIFLVYY